MTGAVSFVVKIFTGRGKCLGCSYGPGDKEVSLSRSVVRGKCLCCSYGPGDKEVSLSRSVVRNLVGL